MVNVHWLRHLPHKKTPWGIPMSKPTDDMSKLDDLLVFARNQPPQPSGRLMERVAVDAVAYLVEKTPPDDVLTTRPGWMRQVLQGLGGWPAIGGLATATCAGIWLASIRLNLWRWPPKSFWESKM